MASGMNVRPASIEHRILTAGLVVVTLSVFVLLLGKHYELNFGALLREGQNAAAIALHRAGVLDACAEGEEFTAFSPTIYVCNSSDQELVYDEIYTTYPVRGGGREEMYEFLSDGERERADELLENVYFIERYEPVTLPSPLTWTEDPFNERYWRFLFYSLRPTRHLLAAGLETKDERYFTKLREIVDGFLTNGMDATFAWDDHHGVAFRTMALVNTWWKLRESGELPNDLSDKILAALEAHGDFLLDPDHYESGYNHAITQAGALLVLAHSFPDLANAPLWRQTAIERIDTGLQEIIDEDGVLIENSPYYHFYVLEKYWEIRKYAEAQDIVISEAFDTTIDEMIEFATYVLTPELQPPLLGASIPREIARAGEFREIAERYPEFDYVITRGEDGNAPEEQYRFFPSSGIGILRSGWGTERPYGDELFVLFDTGPYRTDHSDLDALTFIAYAAGTPIVRDTGLFTYETDHALYEYFHGTRGHNTVMVDGTDQQVGSGSADELVTGDGYAYLAARHELYPGVVHDRALMHIEDGAVLVIDNLTSNTSHTYEQLFHLSERATVTDETPILVRGHIDDDGGRVPFSVEQLAGTPELTVFEGNEEEARGLCATAYETLTTCPELSFTTQGADARYVTLIRMGPSGESYGVTTEEDGTIRVTTDERTYAIQVEYPDSGSDEFIALSVDTTGRNSSAPSFFDRARAFISDIF